MVIWGCNKVAVVVLPWTCGGGWVSRRAGVWVGKAAVSTPATPPPAFTDHQQACARDHCANKVGVRLIPSVPWWPRRNPHVQEKVITKIVDLYYFRVMADGMRPPAAATCRPCPRAMVWAPHNTMPSHHTVSIIIHAELSRNSTKIQSAGVMCGTK